MQQPVEVVNLHAKAIWFNVPALPNDQQNMLL